MILYTSGTTGQPKGAELSHLNMTFNATASRDIMLPLLPNTVDERPVSLISLPLFHSTGQTAQMNAGIAGGYRLILLPRFDPAAVFAGFEAERVNCWVGVPTMYWALMQYGKQNGVDMKRRRLSAVVFRRRAVPLP